MPHVIRLVATLALVAGAAACTPEEIRPDSDDDDTGSACAPSIPDLSMTVVGLVQDAEGAVVAGATVSLEDRDARPTKVFDTDTTAADGTFELSTDELEAWPGCWSLVTAHYVTATADGAEVERFFNRQLSEAVRNDSSLIDITERPLILE